MKHSRFLHLVAHRGNAEEYPENTLPAIRSALELGVRFIALDIQVAGNGMPMVMRDYELSRIAGACGTAGQMTGAELAQLDVSEPQRFGDRFRGTCIPRLIDALGLLGRRPESTAFLLIGRGSIAALGPEAVVAQVLEALKPWKSRCVVVCSDLTVIYRARQTSGIPIGWIIPSWDNHTRLKYEVLQPEYLFCDFELLPPTGSLWRGPWRWVIQNVVNFDDALDLANRGADFIATRNVKEISDAMRAHALMRAGTPQPTQAVSAD